MGSAAGGRLLPCSTGTAAEQAGPDGPSFELYRAPQDLAAELLDMSANPTAYAPLSDHTVKTDQKPEHTVLAMCLSALEKIMSKDCWRNPSSSQVEYLETLVTWGTPSAMWSP